MFFLFEVMFKYETEDFTGILKICSVSVSYLLNFGLLFLTF